MALTQTKPQRCDTGCIDTGSNLFCKVCGHTVGDRRVPQIAPSALPSQRNSIAPRRPNNSFEKGNRLDERDLAYLDHSGQPVKMGESFNTRDYTHMRQR